MAMPLWSATTITRIGKCIPASVLVRKGAEGAIEGRQTRQLPLCTGSALPAQDQKTEDGTALRLCTAGDADHGLKAAVSVRTGRVQGQGAA